MGYDAHKAAFLRHIRQVRQVVGDCLLYLGVETNMGSDVAGQHENWLKEAGIFVRIVMLQEASQGQLPGVTTTSPLKWSMTEDFHPVLEKQWMKVYAGCVGNNPAKDIREIRNQFMRYSRWPKKSKVPGISIRVPVSGKGATNSQNDDGATCLMLNYAMFKIICTDAGYLKYRHDYKLGIQHALPKHSYTPLSIMDD
jgi:hypothetical protein